jgi:hypothetical protein
MLCFLIASLRCCRKVRGFSLGNCCKAKLLFYIDTWHSGEQISELFWASVSSFEEWGIWSRLNYFLPLRDGWSGINTIYPLHHFFWFSNVGKLNPGLCTCWADILPLSYIFTPIYIYFSFYRKGLIGVWYCNLRNPVKATSLCHQRHIEARPQYKAFNIYKPEDWKVQIPSRQKKS